MVDIYGPWGGTELGAETLGGGLGLLGFGGGTRGGGGGGASGGGAKGGGKSDGTRYLDVLLKYDRGDFGTNGRKGWRERTKKDYENIYRAIRLAKKNHETIEGDGTLNKDDVAHKKGMLWDVRTQGIPFRDELATSREVERSMKSGVDMGELVQSSSPRNLLRRRLREAPGQYSPEADLALAKHKKLFEAKKIENLRKALLMQIRAAKTPADINTERARYLWQAKRYGWNPNPDYY